MPPLSWTPSHRPDPSPGRVDVHRVGLDCSNQAVERLWPLLDADERSRADRFAFPELRRRFVAAHGFMRLVLAGYLNAAPDRLRFELSDHGKPRLVVPRTEWQFNLSHSGERALCAVCHGLPVGVDIERARDNLDALGIARRFFTPDETHWLESAPDHQRRERFLTLWTRKEAIIKAVGRGLWMSLDQFQVTARDGSCPGVVRAGASGGGASGGTERTWALCDLPRWDEYCEAVAVLGDVCQATCHDFPSLDDLVARL